MLMVMKQVVVFLVSVCVLCVLGASGTTSAETVTVQGNPITVTARVAATHYLIVNDKGEIVQIVSNTNGEAKPRVFLNKVARGQEHPLTDDISRQYKTLVPTGQSHVGTIYVRTQLPEVLPTYSPLGFLHTKLL
jgi:hypothetical protein